jgi:DNA-binding MarR family transcriptional regulator
MKFIINVNQKKALELGLTNINQAIIFDLLSVSPTWASHEVLDGEVYFWVARQKICEELEILNLKYDTIYRHLKSLEELGLIEFKKSNKKDLIKITKLGKSYYVGNRSENNINSDLNPNKLGNRSENNSDLNPTYKDTNIINNTIIIKENIKRKTNSEFENDFEEFWIMYKIHNSQSKKKAKELYINHRNKKSKEVIIEAFNNYLEFNLKKNGNTRYFMQAQRFLNKNEEFMEWINGSDNHQSTLNMGNTTKSNQGITNKSQRIEEDVFNNRSKIRDVLGVIDEKPKEIPF